MQALRRMPNDMADFPRDVQELLFFLRPAAPGQKVRAIPGEGADVPVWILGSSLGGAQLAASLGLPFAFASHFAPGPAGGGAGRLSRTLQPSPFWTSRNVMLSLTRGRRRQRRGSAAAVFHARNRPPMRRLPPPIPDYEQTLDPQRLALIQNAVPPFGGGRAGHAWPKAWRISSPATSPTK